MSKALSTTRHHEIRERICAGLTGEVMELGFGSGLNVTHYPAAVTHITAVEPSGVAWNMSEKRRAAAPVPVSRSGLDGQRLPFADASFDSVLSTWTMCTIPDVAAALREVRRVLRPGGRLLFVEHGAAPDASVLRWQRRIDPVQRRVFDGCHVSRPIDDLLTAASLPPQQLERFYLRGEPRWFGHLFVGHSVKAD